MSFNTLSLPEALLQAVIKVGYTEPTPVQSAAIPLIQAGHDLLAEAQTGTGKTAAFALPILQAWEEGPPPRHARSIHALVLAPTRELALQVAAAFRVYGQALPRRPRVIGVIGGEDMARQVGELRRGADVVVATPGRLLELLEYNEIFLRDIRTLVLDEADKLLNLGFAEELAEIWAAMPQERQTLLFSATFPPAVEQLAQQLLVNPQRVLLNEAMPTVEAIAQRVIEVDRDQRGALLRHLITAENWEHVLVFVASKRAAANLTTKLKKHGVSATAFHGDLSQGARIEALSAFYARRTRVLIATDIAARGLDIPDLSHVVNFDLPRSPADYVHRIGRTGRAGKSGMAVSLIDAESQAHFALIEKRARIRLEREQIPGFEPSLEAVAPTKGAAPVKGKRKSKKDKAREAAQNQMTQQARTTHQPSA
ncbi:MAG: DEAD/DEAH box helicase [Candidatus Sericytochromatia bacterium]